MICCSDFTDSILYGNLKNVSLRDIIHSPKRKDGQRQYVTQKFDVCEGCTEFIKLDEKSNVEYRAKIEPFNNKDKAIAR